MTIDETLFGSQAEGDTRTCTEGSSGEYAMADDTTPDGLGRQI